MGGEGIFIHADVSNAHEVNLAVKKAVDTFGKLDVGVNNAAIIGDFNPMQHQNMLF